MEKYRVKVIKGNGVMSISILDGKKHYTDDTISREDPKGIISKEYTDKKYKRYSIINKLKQKYEKENSMAVAVNE